MSHISNLLTLLLVCAVWMSDTVLSAPPTDEEIARFNHWLEATAVSPPLVHIAATPTMGLGIIATPNKSLPLAKHHTVLLELPIEAALCREGLEATQRTKGYYQKYLAPLNEEQVVLGAFLIEYSLGDLSPWAAWMRVVPQPPDIRPPYAWPLTAIKAIEPKSVQSLVERNNHMLRNSFVQAQQRLLPNLKNWAHSAVTAHKKANASYSGVVLDDAWTFERFLWAKALIDSRAWNIQGKKYFVPGADFFNHEEDDDDAAFHFTKRLRFPQRSDKFVRYHKIVQKAVTNSKGKLVATKIVQVLSDRPARGYGEPLHESYGDNVNDIYFVYHGFLPGRRNRRDCQQLPFGDVIASQQATLSEAVLKFLRKSNAELVQKGDSGVFCVHLGELPPFLEQIGLAQALLTEIPDDMDLPICVGNSGEGIGPQRNDPLLHVRGKAVTKALLNCAVAAVQRKTAGSNIDAGAALWTLLLDRSYDIQRRIVVAAGKAEFTTLNTTRDEVLMETFNNEQQSVSRSESSSVSYNDFIAAKLRVDRRTIVKRLLSLLKTEKKNGMMLRRHGIEIPAAAPLGELKDADAKDL